jgi:hypothetical protein
MMDFYMAPRAICIRALEMAEGNREFAGELLFSDILI